MSHIAFWSNQHGSGVTSSIAAIAAVIGCEYQIRSLVAQPQWNEATLEYSFSRSLNTFNRNLSDVSGTGIDALVRLARSGKLEKETVKNNALVVERDRLDLLSGSDKMDQLQFENSSDLLVNIFNQAKAYYDCTMIDVVPGNSSPMSNSILAAADVVVVCLPQNQKALENYFNERDWPEALKGKKHMLLFTQHDSGSKYKAANIARKYRQKSPVLTLPYNTDFRDSLNDGDVKSFFKSNAAADRRHANYEFVSEIRRTAKLLLEEIGINTQIKRIDSERGAS